MKICAKIVNVFHFAEFAVSMAGVSVNAQAAEAFFTGQEREAAKLEEEDDVPPPPPGMYT